MSPCSIIGSATAAVEYVRLSCQTHNCSLSMWKAKCCYKTQCLEKKADHRLYIWLQWETISFKFHNYNCAPCSWKLYPHIKIIPFFKLYLWQAYKLLLQVWKLIVVYQHWIALSIWVGNLPTICLHRHAAKLP